MWDWHYLYLALNLGTLLGPLALSFDRKVAYYRRWGRLAPAIALPGAVFILWDWQFTEAGVWAFSHDYTLGLRFLSLPLEEWLFFLTVPYATVFIYDCLNAYFPWRPDPRPWRRATFALGGACLLTAALFQERAYTVVTFGGLGAALLALGASRRAGLAPLMFRAWAVALIPFFAVNGVLTALPVVLYNPAEQLGLRLGTIPLEDAFYGFLLFLGNVALYERGGRVSGGYVHP